MYLGDISKYISIYVYVHTLALISFNFMSVCICVYIYIYTCLYPHVQPREVLSMAGLDGVAPIGTSTLPGSIQRLRCWSREASAPTEPALLQLPSHTTQCKFFCASMLLDTGMTASVVRNIFLCLSCSTQLTKQADSGRPVG